MCDVPTRKLGARNVEKFKGSGGLTRLASTLAGYSLGVVGLLALYDH